MTPIQIDSKDNNSLTVSFLAFSQMDEEVSLKDERLRSGEPAVGFFRRIPDRVSESQNTINPYGPSDEEISEDEPPLLLRKKCKMQESQERLAVITGKQLSNPRS